MDAKPNNRQHPREPDDTGVVEEIMRIESQNDIEAADSTRVVNTKAKDIKISFVDSSNDIEILYTPNHGVEVSLANHPIYVELRAKSGGEMEISVASRSTVKPEAVKNSGDDKEVFRIHPRHRRPRRSTVFPFLDLPLELRLLVYKFVLDGNETGWGKKPHKRNVHFVTDLQPLGQVQKLLWINRQVREEVSNEAGLFDVNTLHIGHAKSRTLDFLRGLLEMIGETGRENIRGLAWLPWWTPDWGDESLNTPHLALATEVVRLLKSCRKLQWVMIYIPPEIPVMRSRHGLSVYERVYGEGFGLLPSIKHVRNVSFTTCQDYTDFRNPDVREVTNWVKMRRIKNEMRIAKETQSTKVHPPRQELDEDSRRSSG
ncbi:hypothetical protein BU16DRAFT_543558 [Lophium mytilinum]|uniref:Uncharacterized protein n=1 Tax=Lophium mytilinum TaxID=390894 RepID=A0A6A6QDN0_9PEZI|nr:hypothetical protein BU16DRAFT_543558 [Lophium mytilinum]